MFITSLKKEEIFILFFELFSYQIKYYGPFLFVLDEFNLEFMIIRLFMIQVFISKFCRPQSNPSS